MKRKCLISITLLFLFLCSICTASTGTGESDVKVFKVVDGKNVDITQDNTKSGDSKNQSGLNTSMSLNNMSTDYEEQTSDTSTKSKISGVEAVSDAVTTGGINIGYRIGDEFLKGGFKLSSVGVENKHVTDNKTLTYNLYSKELNPFKEESVRQSVIITYVIHIVIAICIIFLGVCRYIAQLVSPKKTTRIMAGFSGEYVQFDIVCFLILCLGVILMPIFDIVGISYCIFNRNIIAGLMTSQTLDITGATTESLPTYILVNIAWYFNNLERLFGEYAVNTMVKLLIVKTWVQAAIVLFGSLTKAAWIQAGAMIGFVLVLLMDIITLYFVSSGINYGVSDGGWGHALIGMGVAAVFDLFIIIGLMTFPFLILYSRIRSGRLGGRV